MNRTEQFVSESAGATKDFDVKQYTWHIYNSDRGVKLEGLRGRTTSLRKGDLFGVKEFTSKEDKYLVLNAPDAIFKVGVSRSDKIMDKSKETKKVPKLPTAAPKKVKIDLNAKPKKTVKEAASAKPKKVSIKPAQPEKVKLTLTQKKIAKAKEELKRLKGLTPNKSNLRKIEQVKEDLKKLRAKEKKEGSLPKDAKQPAVTSKPVNPHTETKKIAAKKVKINLRTPVEDEDEEEIPSGSVRYGGKLIEPDELEFDDDMSGEDLPIPEGWAGHDIGGFDFDSYSSAQKKGCTK